MFVVENLEAELLPSLIEETSVDSVILRPRIFVTYHYSVFFLPASESHKVACPMATKVIEDELIPKD